MSLEADSSSELQERFGNVDVYLFDQLLRGRIQPDARVLDAGCGGGRNLVYLLGRGNPVVAVDRDPDAVEQVRALVEQLAPEPSACKCIVGEVDALDVEDASCDVVLCNAVLHFAHDHAHFDGMVAELWRALAPGGLLFCRLASSIGLEQGVRPLGGGRFLIPDGSERYLVDQDRLLATTARLGGMLVDPLKTTNVQGLRCMTTWVVAK